MHIGPPNPISYQKFSKFRNLRLRMAAILKIEKSLYLHYRLANFDKSGWWCMLILQTLMAVQKSNMADGRHFKNH